jgi:hypothetical protein
MRAGGRASQPRQVHRALFKLATEATQAGESLAGRTKACQVRLLFAKDDLSISLITYREIYEGIHFWFFRFLRG